MEWQYYLGGTSGEFLSYAISDIWEATYSPILELKAKYEILNFYTIEAVVVLNKMLYEADLGQLVAISLGSNENKTLTYYSGILCRFKFQGSTKPIDETSLGMSSAQQYIYKIYLHPSLWKLGHEKKMRIFENKTKKTIIAQILTEAGISFSSELVDEGEILATNTQYNETTLDYIIRLMQEEGIVAYYGNFGLSTEPELVLKEKVRAQKVISLTLNEFNVGEPSFEEILDFEYKNEPTISDYSLYGYNFQTPNSQIKGNAAFEDMFNFKQEEVNINISSLTNANEMAQLRFDSLKTRGLEFIATTTSYKAQPGDILHLENYDSAFNYQYFIEKSCATLKKIGNIWQFRNILSGVRLMPEYTVPLTKKKPAMNGTQVAIVAGDAANSKVPNVDKMGRIKVKFIWNDATIPTPETSGWARVSQWGSAGSGWGNVCLPRVGQEVIVGFINADADQPIILGALFNGANEFPNTMPDDAANLTIKQASDGNSDSRYNQIRMVNKELEEKIEIRAQEDLNLTVLGSMDEEITGSKTTNIDSDLNMRIQGDRFERFGKLTILPDDLKLEALAMGEIMDDIIDMSSMDKGIKLNHISLGTYVVAVDTGDIGFLVEKGLVSILCSRYNLVTGLGYSLVVGASASLSVAGSNNLAVTGANTAEIEGDNSLEVGGANTINVTGDYNTSVEGIYNVEVVGDYSVEGSIVSISALADLNIEAVGAISIKAAGAISIMAGDFSVDAAAIELTSAAVFEVTASAVTITGAIIELG